MMNKTTLTALTGTVCICTAPASIADVDVTDACQDEIRELQEKINDSKDDYTAESRRRAENHVLAAKTNCLNPAGCRGNILDARKELQEGWKDRRKEDKDKSGWPGDLAFHLKTSLTRPFSESSTGDP